MNIVGFGHRLAKLCLAILFLVLLVLGPHSAVRAGTSSGFHLNGRFLYDANDVNFVMRGVNHPHTWFQEQTNSFAHIKARGANTVRVVLSSGAYWEGNSAEDVANVIELCKSNELICVLEVHDTTGYVETPAISLAEAVQYWISIKDVLDGEEAYIIINIGNEPYGNDATENWLDDTKDAIAAMRTAGFQHMLMVDAPNWGQDWEHHMRDHAAEILASDPNGNTVFSIHMYGVYEDAEDIDDYISTFVDAGLPIVIGEFGHQHTDGDPDEDAILSVAETYGVGYLGWSWSGNSGVGYLDMVIDFNPSKLSWWGKRIIYGEDGICLESVESSVYGGDRDPMVCSIKLADPNPTNASLVRFAATFSETVTDVGIDDFTLTTTDVTGSTITNVSGSGSAYTITVNTGAGNGTLRLNLVDNDSIKDGTNHALAGGGAGNGSFNLGEIYTIKRSKPVLLSPANGALAASSQPTLDWRDSTPAFAHYHVQVSTNNAFTSLVVDETNVAVSSFTPASGLIPGRLYYWRVKGFDSVGDTNPWSTVWTFKTPLPQPTLLSPVNAESMLTDRPTFNWDDVLGVTQYNIQVSAVANFSTLLVSTTITGSEYTATKDLPQNKTLYWRVRAKTSVVTGPWSLRWSFITGNPASVPVLVAPVNNALVKDYTPLLNWNNSKVPTGSTFKHYEIQVDDQNDFSSPTITATTTPADIAESDFTPPTDLPSNTKFYWRVRAINTFNAVDHISGWSTVWSFRTVIPAPTGLTVIPNGLQPSFEWDDAAAPITGYTIQISTKADFSTFLVNSTTQNSFYTILKNLPSGKTLYWRVRVNGPHGPSAWTSAQFVTP